ncbi:MAG TPA: helix-turn-helix transcriptional regulator [Gaiellaceae bacterium]|nr:helix-turn-helix transcriptional regulator [Gaiellaceae bacterium]
MAHAPDANVSATASLLDHLSRRELEVLDLVCGGATNSEIGARLGLTVHAVKFHLASVYRKLGVANRTEAAAAFLTAAGAPRSAAAKELA